MGSKQASAPRVYFPDRAALRAWLHKHHATHPAIWLEYDKLTGGPTKAAARKLSYDDIVEEALCFGWIDSVTGSVSESRAKLYFSPRKPGSGWSALNKKRIEKLEAAGMLTQAGLAKIRAAKADGSWTLLDSVERLAIPEDLRAALDKNARAKANFDAFPPGARKQILFWIHTAKRAETRLGRITMVVSRAARNIRDVGGRTAPKRSASVPPKSATRARAGKKR